MTRVGKRDVDRAELRDAREKQAVDLGFHARGLAAEELERAGSAEPEMADREAVSGTGSPVSNGKPPRAATWTP